MARPQKKGLEYFPLDVDIFSDKKIRILMARYGSDGYTLYNYLLCEIFKEGYFIKTDDDFDYLVSSALNMSYEKIGQIRNFLLERSLFDDKLFRSDKVLTSKGIQRRYQQAVKARAVKTAVNVDARFWLLEKEETETFIKVRHNADFSEKNGNYSEKNNDNSENYDTKKSKVKKSKVKESKVLYRVPAVNGYFEVTQELYDELTHTYPDTDIDVCLKKITDYLNANPSKRRYINCTEGYICMWIGGDNERGTHKRKDNHYGATYDIAEFEKEKGDTEEW
ncbi:MAG: DUF4373 domain-containing protein [Clostridia bacterium]|nr:DUF4373 domain-containing protein [Clostridia bacterium]